MGLISRIVQYRVNESMKKAAGKTKRKAKASMD
jgi:hypothetical protein